jgi:hypothetical protein
MNAYVNILEAEIAELRAAYVDANARIPFMAKVDFTVYQDGSLRTNILDNNVIPGTHFEIEYPMEGKAWICARIYGVPRVILVIFDLETQKTCYVPPKERYYSFNSGIRFLRYLEDLPHNRVGEN